MCVWSGVSLGGVVVDDPGLLARDKMSYGVCGDVIRHE